MKNVLVTHADEPMGRRVVKRLFHDERIGNLFAVGGGAPPRSFDRFLGDADSRVCYARVDLSKHRAVNDLFHSARFRTAAIDTLVQLPRHGAVEEAPASVIAGLPRRTAETRLVVQHCLEAPGVQNLIAVGSAFVYRLPPGNANRFDEDSELDLEPDVLPEIRSWIDCDMIIHGEVHNDRMRVVLLRVPTVVTSGGFVYLNPSLSGPSGSRVRIMGFDPICALVSDKDVARAVQAAIHADNSGIYNVAGGEAVPLSVLARWTGRASLPVPGSALAWLSRSARLLGIETRTVDASHLRYGFTLDTQRIERDLDFRPSARIGLARAGDGSLRLETAST
jgi:nucleoside-diphosphate-sugar epimerase